MLLLATDLDGTIIGHDGRIAPCTVAALRECHERGVILVAVTGRPRRWLPSVVAEVPFFDHVICSNGGYVVEVATQEVIRSNVISAQALASVLPRVSQLWPNAGVGVEALAGLWTPQSDEHPWYAQATMQVASMAELAQVPGVVKLLARDLTSTADEMLTVALAELAHVVDVTHSNSNDPLLEMSGLGVNKGAALSALAQDLGIEAADVVAFGDMPNDASMLMWAGRGYAMADGHPDLMAIADAVAPPMAEHGVACVLEELLGGRA